MANYSDEQCPVTPRVFDNADGQPGVEYDYPYLNDPGWRPSLCPPEKFTNDLSGLRGFLRWRRSFTEGGPSPHPASYMGGVMSPAEWKASGYQSDSSSYGELEDSASVGVPAALPQEWGHDISVRDEEVYAT